MHDKDGDALLLVLPNLPSELREPLVRQLQLTFGQRLALTDSQKAGEELRFETFHFTHYILPGYVVPQLLCKLPNVLSRATNVLQLRILLLTIRILRKRR
jgi:hypothetical protein